MPDCTIGYFVLSTIIASIYLYFNKEEVLKESNGRKIALVGTFYEFFVGAQFLLIFLEFAIIKYIGRDSPEDAVSILKYFYPGDIGHAAFVLTLILLILYKILNFFNLIPWNRKKVQ